MKYRPVAPDDLDTLVSRLVRLSGETVLPWHFDPDTKQFYVEQQGQRLPVIFAPGDTETQLVELLTAGLPLLLDAIHKRFVIIDRESIRAKSVAAQERPAGRHSSDNVESRGDAEGKRPVRRSRSRKR